MEQADIKDIMTCLGQLTGKLDQMEKSQSRTTFALIGVIAAQIGVKVLGTPILLDIATTLAIVGIIILFGALVVGLRLRRSNISLSRTGWSLVAMMLLITITQIGVYFQELKYLDVNTIYIMRIVQNIVILVFAWQLITDGDIHKNKRLEKNGSNCRPEIK